MRVWPVFAFGALTAGCIGPWTEPVAPPPVWATPAHLWLDQSSPGVGGLLDPSGHVAFKLGYSTGPEGPGTYDIGVELAAPPGATYTIPRPCASGLPDGIVQRAACDVPLALDWPQSAHPMRISFILIKRDPGDSGAPYVGRVVATLGPLVYAN